MTADIIDLARRAATLETRFFPIYRDRAGIATVGVARAAPSPPWPVDTSAGPFDGVTILHRADLLPGHYVAGALRPRRRHYEAAFRDGPLPAWARTVALSTRDFAAVQRGLLPDGMTP